MSHHIYFVDGPKRGQAEVWPLDSEPGSGSTVEAGGATYAFPGTSQLIYTDEDAYWHATCGPVELFNWWREIGRDARLRLSRDPFGPVPGDFAAVAARSGGAVVGGFWPDLEEGTAGATLPHDVQQWIADHPAVLLDWAEAGGPAPGETSEQWYERACAELTQLDQEQGRLLAQQPDIVDLHDPALVELEPRLARAKREQAAAFRASGRAINFHADAD